MRVFLCLFFITMTPVTNAGPLTWIIKQFGDGRINQETAEVMAQKPMQLLKIRSILEKADEYSIEICQVAPRPRRTLDEVDAVRHFIASALLAWHFGPEYARELMLANEGDPRKYSSSNYMDIHNNKVGFEAAAELPVRYYHEPVLIGKGVWDQREVFEVVDTVDVFRRLALRKLKSGELRIIKSKKSECQLSKL